MVEINGSNEDMVIFNTTQSQSLPLGFLEDLVNLNNRSCEMFQFTVQARNDAGMGPVSESIIDTIPICKTDWGRGIRAVIISLTDELLFM